ncbi:unnamed protein product [Schistocephalus solidus]|uniref:Pyrroline-5-carboxylate reductase n=1 Tax=Schistocephalus solidus TaxID=70667 RepID=A0A183TRG9_SCHSO|nr:unnamed protein product [Schistocephalus solidus]
MKQISVFGCGAMGTNIANLLAENVTRLDDYKNNGLLVTEPTETVPDQVIRLVSEEILRVTKSPCVVVSGGVNAKGLANGDFAEATIGCPNPERAEEAKLLLQVY